MAFNAGGLRLWDEGGLASPSVLDPSSSNFVPRMWIYRSSDSSTDVTANAYFAGVGLPTMAQQGGRQGFPMGGLNMQGMMVGDVVLNVPSTAANTTIPRMHLVTSSTPDTATSASTFYYAKWNCTVASAS
jgi:hypothetical protein